MRGFPPARRRFAAASTLPLVLTLGLGSAVVATDTADAAASGCQAMTSPIYYRVNPKGSGLLTPWSTEASRASRYGFSDSLGAPILASTRPAAGLTAVHRMYRRANGDFAFAVGDTDRSRLKQAGYVDSGNVFYALTSPSSGCTQRVERFAKGGYHQVTAGSRTAGSLSAAHWTSDKVAFYAPTSNPAPTVPPPTGSAGGWTTPPLTGTGASNTDGVFTIAVLPDTQQEVFGNSTRFADRNRWIVANRKKYDIRYVTQVGDLVNWDTPNHDQYANASSAMSVLEKAGVPWSPTIGNHDSEATCQGGSACPGQKTWVTMRDTHTFNRYFPVKRFRAMKGEFEAGKVDNSWSSFSAEGRTFMVMNLELWPRPAVVAWANKVVKAHPHDNVIVVTHSYLTGNGGIFTKSEYGSTSPEYLWKNFVSKNPNVKLVLSGHVGSAASRIDPRGKNPVVSYLQCFHDIRRNPTRLITVNVKAGTLRGQVYYPSTKQWLPSADKTYRGLVWVK
ncbi:hypothetical protein FHX74_002595 [Friedmanniella endophytica]|uniref:Calcineurin-like phosphoesterase n=1 Tax=Microlunatus kandeliicorticis TaxID=1759536 RepID=A0A7W3P6H9_9ACTN|nr:metallophosphoesterase [Microlunatus kandeliicorticis]MBA8794967.1 hypothetical protein [Microlunatus kandeliicorticis]